MIWEKIEINPDEVREVARQYRLDLIISSILIRRNYADTPSLRFILEDDLSLLHNPFLFQNMGKAVDRIKQAIDHEERIMIFGDRDVDGVTSTVLMVQFLQDMGARVYWQLPLGEEDYGLTSQVIESTAAEGCNLLITVDCGISNIDEIALASKKGIDTIVLDHHNPQNTLPEAIAIINPKCEECGYPFRDLSGCGVAAKLVWAFYFSKIDLYRKPVWLLHIKPDNETYTAEAVQLINLVEQERIIESLIPLPLGSDFKKTRVSRFLSGREVLVYEREEQWKLLNKIGARDTDLKLIDLQPQLQELFPHLAGKSLLRIKDSRRPAPQGRRQFDELDTLVSLFNTMVLKRNEALLKTQARIMDLAALGTIADLMPLIDENKIIVKNGLKLINKMERSGLRELLIKQNLYGKRITTRDIAWQISPVLNSAGRMGEPDKAAQIFLSNDPEEIERLIDYILDLNRKRKNLGEKIWNEFFSQAVESLNNTEGKLVSISDSSIPRGITGILASRLVSFFKVPAMVIAVNDEKSVGSLRSPYPINDFLDLFKDIFLTYGGHDCAAGFSLSSDSLSQFETRFSKIAKELQPSEQGEEKIRIDAEVPPSYLNPDLIKVVEFFEPYGEGCPPLVFLTRRVRIDTLNIIGKREASHLKILFGVEKYRWPAVYWNAAERAGKDFTVNDTVDIVYRLSRNYFQNTESLQLTILDIRK